MTITQVITPLPPAPQRTDAPADFVTKADAHVASLDGFVTELNTATDQINTTQGEINTTQGEINTTQSEILTTQTEVEASAAEAAASAALAESTANFKGLWSGLTGALALPASVEHNGVNWQLLNPLADVTTSEPGATADWSEINPNEAITHTGGGDLSAALPNQIHDGSTYDLPLAANYSAGKYIDVEKPETYKANTPTVQRKTASSDVIGYSGGTDTDVLMDVNTSEFLRFTSDGVNTWSL